MRQFGRHEIAGDRDKGCTAFDELARWAACRCVDTLCGPGANLYAENGCDLSSDRPCAVVVGGYRTLGDGGGGVFYWDASASTGDDGGTIVVPTGCVTGRWRRLHEPGTVNARWFGAGLGGGRDQAIVADAIRRALPGGGTIYLPRGVYRFADTLTIHEGVSLRGDGDATLLVYSGSGDAVRWRLSDAREPAVWGGCIERLQITTPHSSGAQNGIRVTNGYLGVIRDVTIDGRGEFANACIFVESTGDARDRPAYPGVTIAGAHLHGGAGDGILVCGNGETVMAVISNRIRENAQWGIRAIPGEGGRPGRLHVEDNVIEGNGCGAIRGSFLESILAGNRCVGDGSECPIVFRDPDVVHGIEIIGNHVTNAAPGNAGRHCVEIDIVEAANASGIVIVQNEFQGAAAVAVSFRHGDGSVVASNGAGARGGR
jgi:hypothetical protein